MADIGGGGAGGAQPPEGQGVPGPSDPTGGGDDAEAGPGQTEGATQSGPPGGGDAPELGAGGTSQAAKGGPEADMAGLAKGAGAVAAVPAAGVASQLMVIAAFLNWLKAMMAAAVAGLMNLASLIGMLALTAAKSLIGGLLALGAGLAVAVGGPIGAAAGAAITVGASVLALVGLGAGTVHTVQESNATAQRDALPPDCRPMTEATVSEIDDNAQFAAGAEDMEETAQQVYSFLAGLGMQDENIAGVLGNFHKESLMDPTTVETIYDEGYIIGPRTQQAEDDGFKIELVDSTYDQAQRGIDLVGIGLGQWTNGRNTLLTEYAESTGGHWADMETQLSFMVSADDPARVEFLNELIEDSSGSVEGSTRDFLYGWEGLTAGEEEVEERQGYSSEWFARMDSWEADKEWAGSVLEQADTTVALANDNRRANVVEQCRTANVDEVSHDEVVQAGELLPCSDLGQAHPDACALHEHLNEKYGAFYLEIHGQRGEPGSNHHNGQAIDYMMAPGGQVPTDDMKESGTAVVNYLISQYEEFNIKGILWQHRVWNPTLDPIADWSKETTRFAGERGDNTQNHVDHVHVSVGPDDFS